METVCVFCKKLNFVHGDCLQSVCPCRYCHHNLFNGLVVDATSEILDVLLQDDLPIVVDFSAAWCRPCRNFEPIFAEVAAERCGQMRFVKVDVSRQRELADRFGVRGLPTIIIFKSGQILDILSGVEPKIPFSNWLDETL